MPRRSRKATAMAKGKTSPKTIAAAVVPAVVTVLAILIQWGVTGEFSKPELATAITGLATSALTGFMAWWVQPGEVIVQVPDRDPVP
jgi:hypothetical protein